MVGGAPSVWLLHQPLARALEPGAVEVTMNHFGIFSIQPRAWQSGGSVIADGKKKKNCWMVADTYSKQQNKVLLILQENSHNIVILPDSRLLITVRHVCGAQDFKQKAKCGLHSWNLVNSQIEQSMYQENFPRGE